MSKALAAIMGIANTSATCAALLAKNVNHTRQRFSSFPTTHLVLLKRSAQSEY
jgi:hypothetical protein